MVNHSRKPPEGLQISALACVLFLARVRCGAGRGVGTNDGQKGGIPYYKGGASGKVYDYIGCMFCVVITLTYCKSHKMIRVMDIWFMKLVFSLFTCLSDLCVCTTCAQGIVLACIDFPLFVSSN